VRLGGRVGDSASERLFAPQRERPLHYASKPTLFRAGAASWCAHEGKRHEARDDPEQPRTTGLHSPPPHAPRGRCSRDRARRRHHDDRWERGGKLLRRRRPRPRRVTQRPAGRRRCTGRHDLLRGRWQLPHSEGQPERHHQHGRRRRHPRGQRRRRTGNGGSAEGCVERRARPHRQRPLFRRRRQQSRSQGGPDHRHHLELRRHGLVRLRLRRRRRARGPRAVRVRRGRRRGRRRQRVHRGHLQLPHP